MPCMAQGLPRWGHPRQRLWSPTAGDLRAAGAPPHPPKKGKGGSCLVACQRPERCRVSGSQKFLDRWSHPSQLLQNCWACLPDSSVTIQPVSSWAFSLIPFPVGMGSGVGGSSGRRVTVRSSPFVDTRLPTNTQWHPASPRPPVPSKSKALLPVQQGNNFVSGAQIFNHIGSMS